MTHALQMFYLLSAYSVLPGAGTYIINVVMTYVSVRITSQGLYCPGLKLTLLCFLRACIRRSSSSLFAPRSAGKGIPRGKDHRTG